MTRPILVTVLLIGLTTLFATAVVHLVYARGTNEKFADIVMPNGTDGTIRAGVTHNNEGTIAVADYFTLTNLYLGQYREVDGFHATDRKDLERWALAHFGERRPPEEERSAPGNEPPEPSLGPYN